MQFDSSRRKAAFLIATGALSLISLVSISRSAMAERAATSDDAAALRRAAQLEGNNAVRHHWLGRVALFVEQDPATAVRELQETTRLNPWIVDYWLDLALAYKAAGNPAAEGGALDHALKAEPRNLNAVLSEGNFYLSRGETMAAMERFREVLQNDPHDPATVIDICWRATHNVSAVLQALPPRADLHSDFLQSLVRQNEPDAAAVVWQRLVALHQPLDSGYAVNYVDWLIEHKQPVEARAAWDDIQAAREDKPAATEKGELLFNPGFEDDVQNAGFDWRFRNSSAVTLSLDDEDPHSGQHSLIITYNGAPTTDAGVWQIFPASPGTTMRLSAYARTKDLMASIPPRLGIEDFYSHALVATGPEIAPSASWQPTSVDFTVPPDSHLLAVRIVQGPQPTRAKGTLWLDDFQLSKSGPMTQP